MRENLDPWVLSNALRNPGPTRQRLVSLLISRAQLDPDVGALALSEQTGYPAALLRHLERRDPACTNLIPKELAVRWCVLPLGRAHDKRLVVIARDPTPILQAALEHATKTAITLAIVPSLHLERLIKSVHAVDRLPDEPAEHRPPSLAQIAISVDIDDQGPRRARTVSRMISIADSTPELPPLRHEALTVHKLDAVLHDVDRAVTLGAVERLVMAYAAGRWQAALLFNVADGRAIGYRGHGAQLSSVEEIAVQLDAPSILQRAAQSRGPTCEEPDPAAPSAVQIELQHLLGDALALAAAPVLVSNKLHGMLLVGDPRPDTAADSISDLTRLVDALGGAHERFARPR